MTAPAPAAQPADTTPEATTAVPERVAGGFARWQFSLGIIVVGLIIDQITKWIAVRELMPPAGGPITIIPKFFYLRYAENTGAAFSFFTGKVGVLAIVSLAASAFMAWWWYKVPAEEKWGRAALAMVMSGAVGNLIDRIRLRYVIDFLDFYIFSYDYPVFNIADSLICVGVAILLVRAWKGKV